MTAVATHKFTVAVVMRKERIDGPMSRWQTTRWVLDDVLAYAPDGEAPPRRIFQDEREERWLFTGLSVELFRDDAEGYYLNLSSPSPCWFVLWRMEEEATVAQEPLARPDFVSLSYHDAGRWLDAQETVEQVPAPTEVVELLKEYVEQHYVPEPKRRKRPDSFRPLTDRFGNPASVSTNGKKPGAGNG